MNPAHKWLQMKAANQNYRESVRWELEEQQSYYLAERQLAELPKEVVAAAEAECAGQLTFEEVG